MSKPDPQPPGFQEYPKWITAPGGVPVLVASAEDEAHWLGTSHPTAAEPDPPKPKRGR